MTTEKTRPGERLTMIRRRREHAIDCDMDDDCLCPAWAAGALVPAEYADDLADVLRKSPDHVFVERGE